MPFSLNWRVVGVDSAIWSIDVQSAERNFADNEPLRLVLWGPSPFLPIITRAGPNISAHFGILHSNPLEAYRITI